jgi:hypothetical protein
MHLTNRKQDLLKTVYYANHFLFGRDKLYQYIREKYPKEYPTRREVMEWLKTQKVWQLHNRPPPKLIIKKAGRYYSADLTGPLPRDNTYNYIFGIVDVITKMLYTAPLKGLTALEAKNALQRIIEVNYLDISVLQTDNGTHFLGDFHEYLESIKIKHIFSAPGQPWSNQIERVWSTLKQVLYKYWTISNSKKWVKILPILTDNYNNSLHRSISASPIEAQDIPAKVLAERIRKNSVKLDHDKQVEYAVGDRVRVRLDPKSKLEKAKQYYSSIIYTVTKVIKESPNRLRQYKLEKMPGHYNYSDLLSANTSQLPPKIRKLSATRSLGRRGQHEVDQLLENENLRQPPVANRSHRRVRRQTKHCSS